MKKLGVDFKSFIIGVLLVLTLITISCAKMAKESNFDVIKTKKLMVVDEKGNMVAIIGNIEGNGAIDLVDEEGDRIVSISAFGNKGSIHLYNEERKRVASIGSLDGNGVIGLADKYGNFSWGKTAYVR